MNFRDALNFILLRTCLPPSRARSSSLTKSCKNFNRSRRDNMVFHAGGKENDGEESELPSEK